MSTVEGGTPKDGGGRLQNFIFARELAEVYLLLDHLSGRSDKSLAAAFGDDKDKTGVTIQEICKIGWPPEGTEVEQARKAEVLLLAKDRLNASAKPANGASIAFTLMVAGDDEVPADGSHRSDRLRALFRGGTDDSFRSHSRSAEPPNVARGPAPQAVPGQNGGGGAGIGRGGFGGGDPPSRISLARLAYPGLVRSSGRFKWGITLLLLLLFTCLILTCGLSWYVSAGRAIVARLETIETARTAIQKRIDDAEGGDVKSSSTPSGAGKTTASGGPAASKKTAAAGSKQYVQRYCERASRLPPPKDAPAGVKIDQFEDVTQLEICDQLAENRKSYGNAREDIADWLAPLGFLKWSARGLCGGRCLKDEAIALPDKAVNEQQWAAVLVELLATSVLPLCYGFLGAGAAVVRNIWGKMRESLLSPRDLTLSLGQLALGAVIGACVGLFITPGAGGLTGAVTLTPSALSFIGGFGVEGVFVTLESLIKRVFNVPDQKP